MLRLNNISDNAGSSKKPARVGRGIGSGTGKTAGKGHKGQKARAGVALKAFEGGQMPIYRRLPKRGFKSMKVKDEIINLGDLQYLIDCNKLKSGDSVNKSNLHEWGVIRSTDAVIKLLAKGSLDVALNIVVDKVSKAAEGKILSLGGKVTIAN